MFISSSHIWILSDLTARWNPVVSLLWGAVVSDGISYVGSGYW